MAAEEPIPEDLEIADELIAERRAEAPGETPEDMTPWQRPITAVIDVVNYRAGQMIALLMIPLIAVVVYEVISRNLDTVLIDAGFGGLAKALRLGPTLWVYDMSRMIAGVLWMAAAGYGLNARCTHTRRFLIPQLDCENSGNSRRFSILAFLYSSDDLFHMGIYRILVESLFNRRDQPSRQCMGAIVMACKNSHASWWVFYC